jgi:SAM-dependent methyltransferase
VPDRRRSATQQALRTTLSSVIADVSYGAGLPREDELHLLGDVSAGRRVLELGLAGNSVGLARSGAKAIAVDPDPELLADLRMEAAKEGVAVECHQGELADLGFAPSGTIDAVLACHTLHEEDDLDRTLRQVHRVLRTGAPFIMVLDHPFAAVQLGTGGAARRYGDDHRTVGELLTALDRTNFRIEAFHELGVDDGSPVPTTLVVKARKQGS